MRYPLFLDLTAQPVTVIGGGQVATRKIRTLLKARADVTIISPTASSPIARLATAGKVTWIRRPYRRGDLSRARLVIAATDDIDLNRRVCADAKRHQLLVNCVAPPDAGNFIVPASIQRNGLTLAISTSGASPAIAKQVRRDLEQFLRAEYAGVARRLRKSKATRPTYA